MTVAFDLLLLQKEILNEINSIKCKLTLQSFNTVTVCLIRYLNNTFVNNFHFSSFIVLKRIFIYKSKILK